MRGRAPQARKISTGALPGSLERGGGVVLHTLEGRRVVQPWPPGKKKPGGPSLLAGWYWCFGFHTNTTKLPLRTIFTRRNSKEIFKIFKNLSLAGNFVSYIF